MKIVRMLYGKTGMELRLPAAAAVLEAQHVPAAAGGQAAVREALENPIGAAPLAELVRRKNPKTVAITISDITRPVPNKDFLPTLLGVLGECGVESSRIVIIIGTGMHRPSTAAERELMLGADILREVEVIDHTADRPETLVKVSENPPVSVCRRSRRRTFGS